MSALDRAVEAERLSDSQGARRRFTVSREAAIVTARAAEREPWAFTLPLLRAAVLLSPYAWVVASTESEGEHEVISLDFGVQGAAFDSSMVTDLLLASLEADRGSSSNTPAEVAATWRRLVGRGINGALAENPAWVELSTPSGGCRWERAGIGSGRDPYVEQSRLEAGEDGRFRVRIARPPRTLGTNLRSWFVGGGDPLEGTREFWRRRLVVDVDDDEVVPLEPPDPDREIIFPGMGRWIPRAEESAVWLVRQGVRLVPLDTELAEAGLPVADLKGWIECPSLALTVDEDRIVKDRARRRLLVWLADAVRLGLIAEEGKGWPDEIASVVTASGVPVPLDRLGHGGIGRRAGPPEVLFTWSPLRDEVPQALAGRVVALWPSELVAAQRQRPELTWVPIEALGAAATAPRADLAPLASRAFPPMTIEMAEVRLETKGVDDEGIVLRPHVEAYAHKYPDDRAGAVLILAYGRRLARVSDPKRTMPGVTLVVSLGEAADSSVEVARLMENTAGLRELSGQVVLATHARRDELIGRAVARLSGFEPAWHVPVIRAQVEAASAATMGLRYVEGPDDDAYLAWRSDALLALDVGRTLDGRPCRVVDALFRARAVGGIVIGDAHRRWFSLESEERDYETWVLDVRGRELLERVLGPGLLWEMPVVPEALPHPKPAAQQRQLLLDRSEVTKLLQRGSDDALAILKLQAHLLVARNLDEDEMGLSSVALFLRYDPKALAARRLVSLDAIAGEHLRPVLTPIGSGGRWLGSAALEVAPGVAHLLDEYGNFEMAPAPRPERSMPEDEEARPRPSVVRPARSTNQTALVTVPVVSPLAAGALHVDPNADEVVLWARGLRVGEFRLPSPLRDVSGRLWLTEAGIAAGHGRLLAVAIDHARELLENAEAGARLSPPDSERRRGLDAFTHGVRDAVARGKDRIGLELGVPHNPDRVRRPGPNELALREWPDLWLGPLIRYALGRQIHLETAWLSWQAAKVADRGDPGRIELGRLDGWIRRALASGAAADHVLMTAVLVVAEALEQAPEWGSLDRALERLLAAAETIR